MTTISAVDRELDRESQDYGTNPAVDRVTDLYKNEYISSFVNKWDSLIDWDARAGGEGEFFIEVLRSRRKNTVLDVATGTGFHSVRLLDAGFNVTSADGSAAMLARAFENGKQRGHILKTVQADWRWLGQASRERFDAVVCLGNSFTHLHDELDRRRVLAEFYAALEPNGVLIIDQRNYDTMIDTGFKSKHKYYYCGDQVSVEPVHIADDLVRFQYSFPDGEEYTLNLHPIRKDYLRRLLREAGFERIRTYGDFEVAYDKDEPDFLVHIAEKSCVTSSVPVASDITGRARAVAEDYYNGDDADSFYSSIWGGNDLHLGIYTDTNNNIREASIATIDLMVKQLPEISEGTHLIDFGSGYGGVGRRLAGKYGCSVVGLNISETQNDRNSLAVTRAGLADKITITHGSFDDVPAANDTFDIVWSQDAFLHASARDKVIAEAFRVLKPAGHLIFTDPMQKEGVEDDELKPILERLNLDSLGSFELYKKLARQIGFELVNVVDLSPQLEIHFSHILEELIDNRERVEEGASVEYIENMIVGLNHWIDGGRSGTLEWGVMLFRKPIV